VVKDLTDKLRQPPPARPEVAARLPAARRRRQEERFEGCPLTPLEVSYPRERRRLGVGSGWADWHRAGGRRADCQSAPPQTPTPLARRSNGDASGKDPALCSVVGVPCGGRVLGSAAARFQVETAPFGGGTGALLRGFATADAVMRERLLIPGEARRHLRNSSGYARCGHESGLSPPRPLANVRTGVFPIRLCVASPSRPARPSVAEPHPPTAGLPSVHRERPCHHPPPLPRLQRSASKAPVQLWAAARLPGARRRSLSGPHAGGRRPCSRTPIVAAQGRGASGPSLRSRGEPARLPGERRTDRGNRLTPPAFQLSCQQLQQGSPTVQVEPPRRASSTPGMGKHLQEIRDPIHVFVRLDDDEREVLDSTPFQRLRTSTSSPSPTCCTRPPRTSALSIRWVSWNWPGACSTWSRTVERADPIRHFSRTLPGRQAPLLGSACWRGGPVPPHGAPALLARRRGCSRRAGSRADHTGAHRKRRDEGDLGEDDPAATACGHRQTGGGPAQGRRTAVSTWEVSSPRSSSRCLRGGPHGLPVARLAPHRRRLRQVRPLYAHNLAPLASQPSPEAEGVPSCPGGRGRGLHSAEPYCWPATSCTPRSTSTGAARIYDVFLKDFLKAWLPGRSSLPPGKRTCA